MGFLEDRAGDSCPKAEALKTRQLKKNRVVTCFFICTSPFVYLARFIRFQGISPLRKTTRLRNPPAEACCAMTCTACLPWCGFPEEAGSCCPLPPRPERARWP